MTAEGSKCQGTPAEVWEIEENPLAGDQHHPQPSPTAAGGRGACQKVNGARTGDGAAETSAKNGKYGHPKRRNAKRFESSKPKSKRDKLTRK
ncbi:unnamed protein product [Linum trigynum]|uniref:Uncharacterized protein n=1 Tax=Linum trigynum TaxID=586398 RepID=A0AAV2FJC7_9ROSI